MLDFKLQSWPISCYPGSSTCNEKVVCETDNWNHVAAIYNLMPQHVHVSELWRAVEPPTHRLTITYLLRLFFSKLSNQC